MSLYKQFSNYNKQVKKEVPQYSAKLGKTPTVIEHPTRSGFVYARMVDNLNELIVAFNDKVSQAYDLPVLVERRGNIWYVVGRDTQRYSDWGTEAPFLPKHGFQHSFNREDGTGADAVFVYPDQFMPLLVYPSGTSGAGNLQVAPYLFKRDGDFVYVGNTGTPNIVMYRPTDDTAIMGLVYLDRETGNPGLLIASGTSMPGTLTGTSQIVPYLPFPSAEQEPLYFVRLVSGTTAIGWDNLYNARQFIGGGNSSSTGSSGGWDKADYWENNASAGRLWGGIITDAGSGNIDIAAGAGLIKTGGASIDGNTGIPTSLNEGQGSDTQLVTWGATTIALAGVGYNLVYWDASAGGLVAQLKENFYANFNFVTDFTVGRVYYDGTTVLSRLCGMNRWNFDRRVQMFGEERFPVERATGLLLSGTGTRNIAVTAGVLWAELVNRFSIDAFDSSGAGTFTNWYRDGSGGWTQQATQTQINNTQYDDGDGTLATLTANRYGVFWVFVVHDSSVHVVFGQGDYTLAQSQATTIPATLPGVLTAYGSFIGRIIIQKNVAVFTEIRSAFTTTIGSSVVTDHNDLSGVQGGAAGQYYHLTADQQVNLVSGSVLGIGGRVAITNASGTLTSSPYFQWHNAVPGDDEVLSIGGLRVDDATAPVDSNTLLNLVGKANNVSARLAGFVWGSGTVYTNIMGSKAWGNRGAEQALPTNNPILGLSGYGHDGSSWNNAVARIQYVTTEQWTTGSHGTEIRFFATQTGTTSLTQVGNLTPSGFNLPNGAKFMVSGSSVGVTNGDSHDHSGGDGGQIAYSSLSSKPTAETQSVDIYRCDNSGGVSAFVGTIASLPGGAPTTLTYNVTSGQELALVPTSTGQLAKLRLYNTTRGTSALISNSVAATNTITLTANVPAGWTVGDTITIASQTVSSAVPPLNWIDLEVKSALVGKSSIFMSASILSVTAGDVFYTHPFEAFGLSKIQSVSTQASIIVSQSTQLYKLVSNVITIAWTGTPATILLREAGYLE